MHRSTRRSLLGTPLARPRPEGADISRSIARLRHSVDEVDRELRTIKGQLLTAEAVGDLVAVEGPFEGDAPAALATARAWLERAEIMIACPGRAIENAQVAAGGLASRP